MLHYGVMFFYAIAYRIASNAGVPGGNYFILLILTDGIITDMQQTCESIVNVSSLAHTLLLHLHWCYFYYSCRSINFFSALMHCIDFF